MTPKTNGEKRAEELRDSQARLAGIVDSAMDAIITVDSGQRILLFNRAAEKMFRCPAGEAIGQTLDRFLPARFRTSHADHIHAFGRTGVSTRAMAGARAVYGLRAGGEEFPVEASISQVEAGGQKLYTVIMRDVTERDRAEKQFRQVIEGAPNGMVMIDGVGKIVLVNAQIEKSFGYTRDELLGQQIETLVPERFHAHHPAYRDGFIAHPTARPMGSGRDLYGLRKDSSEFPVEIGLNPIETEQGMMVLGTIVDITERKRIEETLRASEEQFRTMANSIPQLAWMAHADGFIFWYNQRWHEYTGTTPEQMAGWGWQSVHDPDVLPQVLERWRGAIATGQPFEMEFPLRGADGLFRTFLNRGQPLKDTQGRVVQWFGTNTDVDKLKRMEESLRDIQARLNSTLAAGSIGTWTWDIVNDRLAADEFTARMFSLEAEAAAKGVPAEEYLRVIHEADRPGVEDALARAIQSCGHYDIEYRVRQTDGEHRWLQARGRVEGDAAGNALNFHGAVMDITDRKRAGETLRRSQEQLAGVIGSAMDAIITVNEEQRIVLFNTTAEKMFLYPAEEAIGQPLDRFIPKRFRPAHRGHVEDFGRTHVTKRTMGALGAIFGLRSDGEEFPIEASISQLESEGRKFYTVILRDITERKRAEEALKEQARILDLAPVLIRDLSGRIIFWNSGSEQMYGWSSEEAVGQISHTLLRTELPRPLEEIKAKLFAYGHWEGELVKTRRDGERIVVASHWVLHKNELDEPKAVLEVNNDITERRRAEESLRASEARFSIAFNASPISSVITTLDEGRYVAVNDTFLSVTGYTREEIIGRTSADLGVWLNTETRAEVVRLLRQEGHVRNRETQYRMKSGEVRVFLTSAEIIELEGQPHLITASVEITERKRAEEEVQRLYGELEQRVQERTAQLQAANKELEAFSYSVSHDLRAPLRHINGFSQALLEDYADKLDEEGRGYLQEVRGASQEMAQLIDDVLQLARVTRSEMRREAVNLSELAQSVIAELRKADVRRQVSVHVEEGLSTHGDKRLLRIVLSNLLSNAWKFTSKEAQPEIISGHEQRDGETLYFVRDNGAGFDMAFADKLFGAFQRLHTADEFEGTGIGLATVQRIINRHGGRVWAEGAVNQGATFYFTLPDFKGERT
jgi:PAS domain S-box-containing protein